MSALNEGNQAWLRLDRGLSRLRPHRAWLSLLLDAWVVVLAWHFTYVFRLGFERWLSARPPYDGWVMLGVLVAYLAAFFAFRVPQSMWRFVGFGEVRRLLAACLVAGVVAAAVVMALKLTKVPRAVLALHPLITLAGLCMMRVAYRVLYEHMKSKLTAGEQPPRRALVLGAGEAAQLLLAGIHRQGWTVVGLLDDDAAKHGARIAGVPVLGALATVQAMADRVRATHLILAVPSLQGAKRRAMLAQAADTGLPVLTVPTPEQLQDGLQVSRVRSIEADDLLGREPVALDDASMAALLRGKTVLVTGAGGSIGSELCRQLAREHPARLILVEMSEFNLYTIDQALGEASPNVPLIRLMGDVKDLPRMRQVMAHWRPDVVFHAAAYKHVPLMEEDANALACLRNNTLGTHHAALAAAEAGVSRFVLISTDKAVNPTNVMGASKRAAEMVMSKLARQHAGTRFVTVRFGNVLGSSGSVIPKFKEQIERGGPVTVTHPDILRYFMTIPEAARLVLQAAALGESGQVLVLDMGEPVKIVDLAKQLIRLAGHRPEDIAIEFSGLRPGEKLYEELLANTDETLPTSIDSIRVAQLRDDSTQLDDLLTEAERLQDAAPGAVRAMLAKAIPEYRPRVGS